jgi:hypothetical protein
MGALQEETTMEFHVAIAGVDDDDDDGEDMLIVEGEDDFEEYIGAALNAANRGGSRAMLRRLSKARPGSKAPTKIAAMVKRMGRISKAVQVQSGKIEAEYLRKPNNFSGVFTPAMAPGAAATAFSVQPGTGMSYYRLLSMVATDEQINLFGFTSLKVGGVEHVNFTQTTPAAPISGLVPWSTLGLKESRGWANLAPWSGQIFDNQTPITGSIANATTAASIDTATAAARLAFLTQVDPCGQRYVQTQQASNRMWKSFRSNMNIYAPLAMND